MTIIHLQLFTLVMFYELLKGAEGNPSTNVESTVIQVPDSVMLGHRTLIGVVILHR